MFKFDPSAYGPAVARLLSDRRPPELGPGSPRSAARADLQRLTREDLAAGRPVPEAQMLDAQMLDACLAGLWLYHDFLDESHALSQSIDTRSGSYWHGILHRREPDYGNAKYWFRQVGRHPIFPTLSAAVLELLPDRPLPRDAAWLDAGDAWDPFRFVDLCERAAKSGPQELVQLCRAVALVEWELLFDYCYQQGVGAAE